MNHHRHCVVRAPRAWQRSGVRSRRAAKSEGADLPKRGGRLDLGHAPLPASGSYQLGGEQDGERARHKDQISVRVTERLR